MRVVILFNPIAGAGRAAVAAGACRSALEERGHDVQLVESRLEPTQGWLDAALDGAEAVVVVGGDGAVRLAAPSAARMRTPLFHVPLGTENLFAREFGMDRDAATLLGALERGDVRHVDVGEVGSHAFLLMVSVGYDAMVVHDLALHRDGGIRHHAYALPMLRQLAAWQPPVLTVTVDGDGVVDEAQGFLVVANSRQYARRLDPAWAAQMDDGLLDMVFFPAASRRELVLWGLKCLRGRHRDDPCLVYRRGRRVAVRCVPPQRFQLDGDAPAEPLEPVADLDIGLRPDPLPVLLPAGG